MREEALRLSLSRRTRPRNDVFWPGVHVSWQDKYTWEWLGKYLSEGHLDVFRSKQTMANVAIQEQVFNVFGSYWLGGVMLLLFFQCAYRRYLHPLHGVPGPFLASITSFWFLAVSLGDKQHLKLIELHAKYGPIVRIRPNTVIVNNPKYFGEYFNWDKSDFWLALRGHPKDIPHINELDVELHKIKKRRVMGGFTMSQILKNESSMDARVMEFMDQMVKRCNTVFDIAPWTQFLTFDIAMEMVFSDPVGFVKQGRDVDGLIASLNGLIIAATVAGLFPWIAKLIYHPQLFAFIGPKPTDKTGPGAVLGFTYRQVARRLAKGSNSRHPDILQWILEHMDRDGHHLTRGELEQEALGPVLAGSDSTGGALRAIVLSVASNPRILHKLRQQIDAADSRGLLSTPPTFEEVRQHVPYLESIFKEAQRLYPIVGSPLFRAVPQGGTNIEGIFLPGKTEVGLSQWAVGHHPGIYGSDVELFRPERWTEDPDDEEEARKLRDAAEIWFGSGPMMCTGRNVAVLEIYKIVTQFFRMFDVEIVNTAQPWKMRSHLAIMHWDFFVKLTERKGG